MTGRKLSYVVVLGTVLVTLLIVALVLLRSAISGGLDGRKGGKQAAEKTPAALIVPGLGSGGGEAGFK